MNCNQYRELLSPYLDGVLQQSQSQDLENHLRYCSSCREELEALRQTVNILQAWSEEELELPSGFEERLRLRLEKASRPWYSQLSKSWLSLSAAAAILLVVAFSAYGNHFNIFGIVSPQQLKSSTSFTLEKASLDSAAPQGAPAPSGGSTLMLKNTEAAKELFQENAIEEKAPLPAAKSPPPVSAEGATPADQLLTNGRERSPSPSSTVSSRVGGEITPSGDEEITALESETSGQDLAQVFEETQEAAADDQANYGSMEAKASGVTASESGVGAENYRGFEVLSENMPPEMAAWAEKNKKTAGVFKTNYDTRDYYQVAMGEKPAEGYEVRLISAAVDDPQKMVVDVEFVEPDFTGPVIAKTSYPYLVFTLPGGTAVQIRAVNNDDIQELPIQEAPPV